jgi:hypothetical protein
MSKRNAEFKLYDQIDSSKMGRKKLGRIEMKGVNGSQPPFFYLDFIYFENSSTMYCVWPEVFVPVPDTFSSH